MRKILSIILIVTMLLSMAVMAIPASAAEKEIKLSVETWDKPWEDPLYAGDWQAIGSADEWLAIFNGKKAADLENHKFYLTADIDFTGKARSGGTNPANFTVDGNGHTITLASTGMSRTLFDNPGNMTIQNLIIKGDINPSGGVYGENSGAWNSPFAYWDAKGWVKLYNVTSAVNVTYERTVNASQYPSPIIANCKDGSELENVKYVGKITIGPKAMVAAVGGLVSYCDGNISFKNCVNDGTIEFLGKAAYYAALNAAPSSQSLGIGGLLGLGKGSATFENCVNNADIFYSGFDVYGHEEIDVETGVVTQSKEPTKQKDGKATTCYSYVGGLYGLGSGGATFINCENNGKITLGDTVTTNHFGYVGGIYGGLDSSTTSPVVMSNVDNNANITAAYPHTAYFGGIIGLLRNNAENSFDNCNNAGTITSYNRGSRNTSFAAMGGLIGYAYAAYYTNFKLNITNSTNSGDIVTHKNGTSYSEVWGGFIGQGVGIPSLLIENCVNSGDILMPTTRASVFLEGSGGFIGGFRTLGDNWAKIPEASYVFKNCLNLGDVTGLQAGGFFGDNSEINLNDEKDILVEDFTISFENCVNAGNINAKTAAGGLAAYVGEGGGFIVNVKNCSNGGVINANTNAGGMFGVMTGASTATVENFVNYGIIGNADTAQAAGIVGGKEGGVSLNGGINLGVVKGKAFDPFSTAGLLAAENNKYLVSATIDSGFDGGEAIEDPKTLIDLANTYEIPFAANYAAINAIINEAFTLNHDDYLVEADWDGLYAACEAAEKVISAEGFDPTSYTQKEANELYLNILKSYVTVVAKTDVSALNSKLAEAKARLLDGVEYTPATVKALEKAIETAEAIAALGERALSTDVNESIEKLTKAIEKLRAVPAPIDYSDLEAAIEEANALEKADYTNKSWKAFEEILTQAKAALSANKQAQVDSALNLLNKAFEALEKKVADTQPVETQPVETQPTEGEGETEPVDEGGCGSVIGGAAVVLTAVIAIGAGISFKKRED